MRSAVPLNFGVSRISNPETIEMLQPLRVSLSIRSLQKKLHFSVPLRLFGEFCLRVCRQPIPDLRTIGVLWIILEHFDVVFPRQRWLVQLFRVKVGQ